MKQAFIFFVLAALFWPINAKSETFEQVLKHPDPAQRYLIFLHGKNLEKTQEPQKQSPYGEYDLDGMIRFFEDQDLTVISQRRMRVEPHQYASRLVSNIRRLLRRGVPAPHVTVAGFGRGGYIALLTASSLADPRINYVLLAACGRNRNSRDYEYFLRRKRGVRLRGRILSVFDAGDLEAGSCKGAFAQAGNRITSQEFRLKSGQGHAVFYKTHPAWMLQVVQWAKQ